MFLYWKIQLEKVQLTRDLKYDTSFYQGIRLPCKNDQGFCDPTTRTKATIVWFPEETCTIFQVAKVNARMIEFHQKNFLNQSQMKMKTLTQSEVQILSLKTSTI